jgi:hypothetical protein
LVAIDASRQHEVVIAPGHLERVELERPQPIDDAHDRGRFRRQPARRRKEVAGRHEPARGLTIELESWGHRLDGMGAGVDADGPGTIRCGTAAI